MTYTESELQEIIRRHALWVAHKKGGRRADLQGLQCPQAEWNGVLLPSADLRGADLRGLTYPERCYPTPASREPSCRMPI